GSRPARATGALLAPVWPTRRPPLRAPSRSSARPPHDGPRGRRARDARVVARAFAWCRRGPARRRSRPGRRTPAMAKQMVFEQEAQERLLAGVTKLARAVKTTLGPRGRCAVLDKGWGGPSIINDGVTVAEEIELKDPYENLGAQLVKEAASKTNDVAGDGTTTATILSEALYRDGLKLLTSGVNRAAIVRGMRAACDDVVEALKKMSKTISGSKEIAQVGTISSNNDLEVGKDGVITVEEGKSL